MDRLINHKLLEPYFKIAEGEAAKSPCSRRQYGALIGYRSIENDPLWVVETNSRQSRCCNSHCVRDKSKFPSDGRHPNVEMGAEIHAETAALIKAQHKGEAFILVGFSGPTSPLYGENVYPCHVCALNIKFAGYKYIYIRTSKDTIQAISIAEIIEYREQEWEYND